MQRQLGAQSSPAPGGFPPADLPAGLPEDMVEELVKGLLGERGSEGGDAAEGGGMLDQLAESIMASLLSKDLLYEPLQEIGALGRRRAASVGDGCCS